jgi:LysM repeat protein
MMNKHRCGSLIIISLLFIWLLTAPGYQAKVQAQSGEVSRSELILAMNTLRVSNGLPPLIEDPIVNAVAQATAEIMAANNMSWHIGDVRGRIAAAGYGGGATVWATENFAVGRLSVDQIMQGWGDAEHARPAVIPAYCHVGAGVAQAADGSYYYVLQAAYTSAQACGEYIPVPGADPGSDSGSDPGSGANPVPPVPQIIIPVKIATPDSEGRIFHIVQSGQSFWSIAIAYKITIHDMEVWNNLSRDNGLVVGQKLFIPSSNTAGYATPTPVGMVLLATPDAGGKIVHEVQPYQALFTIAEAYKIQVDRILNLNGLQVDWPLQIGQKLLINPGNVTPSPTPRPLSAIEQLTPASDGNYYHIVESGEYLGWIADLYEISLTDLMAWNGLTNASIIQPGQQLLLKVTPPATATPIPAEPSATPTLTLTPVAVTSTQGLTATPPGGVASVEAENPPSLPVMVLLPVIVLVVAGLFVLGLAARRRRPADE